MAMTQRRTRPLRIFYAAGPGNVLGTYKSWKDGKDDPLQLAATFSGQFYDVCRELDAQGYIVSSHYDRAFVKDDRFTIEHRPADHPNSALRYHLSYIRYGLGLLWSLLMWRANVVIVADGTTHWFLFSILPLLGIRVIPTVHCVLWRKYLPRKKSEDLFLSLASGLFKSCSAILVASKDIAEQIQQITRQRSAPIVEFLPTYRRHQFDTIGPPDWKRSPFRVMFVGRVERDKGVFDLLAIAKRFLEEGRTDIHFSLCGRGSALDELQAEAEHLGITNRFVLHGHCDRTAMNNIFSQAHVLIAPTTTEFVEGFCQAVVEGPMTGRPVVTSGVCPAVNYVRPAAIEVQPDDVQGYGDALLELRDNAQRYASLCQNCAEVVEQFYDPANGWGAALASILRKEKP